MKVVQRSSPNCGPRRDGLLPTLVVLHHTAMRSAEAALERLFDPAAEVSAHYLIAEDGRAWQLVDEAQRAWHAGAGTWRGMGDINSRSIGIELANAGPLDGFPPFPEPQMAALEAVLDRVRDRWAIPAAGVIAHSDMAPGRKADPGPKFDWRRLAQGGRALWADVAVEGPANWVDLACAAAGVGYGTDGVGYGIDGDPKALLDAVRLRFRPWARGEPSAADVAVLLAVAEIEKARGPA